jgi:hypothetical protein
MTVALSRSYFVSREATMIRAMAAGAVAMIVCGGAAAQSFTMEHSGQQNLAKLIRGFNAVSVRIEPGSERCGIRDANHYAGTLKDALKGVGLEERADAISTAYLFIWGRAFGVGAQQCAMFTSLRLGTDVSAARVELSSRQDADGKIIEEMRKVEGTFPAAFFITSKLGVRLSPTAAAAQDDIIDELVADFKTSRGTASGSQ